MCKFPNRTRLTIVWVEWQFASRYDDKHFMLQKTLRNDQLCLPVNLRMRNADPDVACAGSVSAMAEGVRLCAKNQRRW
jgi:hypothetical protein